MFYLCPLIFSQELLEELGQETTIPEKIEEASSSEVTEFRIRSVKFLIKGHTKERILIEKAQVRIGTTFDSEEDLESFIANIKQRLLNERVLQSAEVECWIEASSENVQEVDLIISVEDSWNIIGLPYFKYDTNEGLLLSIRGRDYNFLGSMQALVLNIDYAMDAEGKQSYGGYTSFGVPFQLLRNDAGLNASQTLKIHADEMPITSISNLSFWYRYKIDGLYFIFEAAQGLQFNPDEILDDVDPFLLRSSLSLSTSIATGITIPRLGDISYFPSLSFYQLWRPDAVVRSDRQGPRMVFSHGLSFGQIDWIANMRRGLSATISNTNTYNMQFNDFILDIDGTLCYSATLGGKIGMNGRLSGFYSFTSSAREDLGSSMRGIRNSRLYGISALFLNLEMPIKLFDFPTHIFIKKNWFDFELQFSPFVDLGYVEGVAGNVAATYPLWYSGGIEFFVYPLRMRTFIVRASLGFDLDAVIQNGSFTHPSPRDSASPYELFFGLGLFL
jgi:hypothetical protein